MQLSWEKYEAWPAVKQVCETLLAKGHKAFLAGGCVRDALLGREPQDFDVATDARPEDVEALFDKTVAVGKAFGVIVVILDGHSIEVASFRSDGPYLDGRRPSTVVFSSPEEDARRRDFTINALFYDFSKKSILDFVDGQKDLAQALIRTVGDPYQRFDEDRLRPMRALRFAAQLDFIIEERTFAAIKDFSDKLGGVAKERLLQELDKLLKAPGRRRGLEDLVQTGLLAQIFPGFDFPKRCHKEWEQTLDLIQTLQPSLEFSVFYAFLFYGDWRQKQRQDLAQEAIQLYADWLKELKADSERIKGVRYLFSTLLLLLQEKPKLPLAEKLRKLEHPLRESVFLLWRSTCRLDGKPEEEVDELKKTYDSIATKSGQLPEPLVTGRDLQDLGLSPGPELGRYLKQVYDEQLEGLVTTREEAFEYLKNQLPTEYQQRGRTPRR